MLVLLSKPVCFKGEGTDVFGENLCVIWNMMLCFFNSALSAKCSGLCLIEFFARKMEFVVFFFELRAQLT